MKRPLIVGFIVGVSLMVNVSFGQTDLPCITGTTEIMDVTCQYNTDGDQCTGMDGHACQSSTFTVNCTGSYQLCADWIVTCGDSCRQCQAEVYVYKGDLTLACAHTQCGESGCDVGCTCVTLERGQTYTLYACKIECAGQAGNCADCGAACVARAKIAE